jgi:hypothetical protein
MPRVSATTAGTSIVAAKKTRYENHAFSLSLLLIGVYQANGSRHLAIRVNTETTTTGYDDTLVANEFELNSLHKEGKEYV